MNLGYEQLKEKESASYSFTPTKAIAVDGTGNAYITGSTVSGIPIVNAKYSSFGGVIDAFVFKLSGDGQTVHYSTYLGGSGLDYGKSITVDGSGNAYVTGTTTSTDFPTVNAKFPNLLGIRDAFVFKLSANGQNVSYSTYLGGSSDDDSGNGIAVDSAGNAYVAGETQSIDFPILNAKYPNYGGGFTDAFIFKLSGDGQTVGYSTYLGGSSEEQVNGIAVDGTGNAYVTGRTFSADFPTLNAKYPNYSGGVVDAFVVKLSSTSELSVTITPDQPVYQDITPSSETSAGKTKHLVALIHGWNSTPDKWANKMRSSITSQLPGTLITPQLDEDRCDTKETADTQWKICTLDWRTLAGYSDTKLLGEFAPWWAYVNALDVGLNLANFLFGQNYNSIHFIVHSAGSQVADTAATWIKIKVDMQNAQNLNNPGAQLIKPTVYTTFLDAYDPLHNVSSYGESSDWSEQYVDNRDVALVKGSFDHTNITLPNAYNFDVTQLDPESSDVLGLHAHSWPINWYQFTVDHKDIFTYGFTLSQESGNTALPSEQYQPDKSNPKRCTFASIVDKTCSENSRSMNVKISIVCPDLLSCYTTDVNTLMKSDTRTVSFPFPGFLKLITGSPVWVTLPIDVTEMVNFVSFDYTFQRQVEGLLSVFFDEQLIYRADERLFLAGEVNHSNEVPIGEITNGAHTLSFRLDAYNNTQSEIDISNVQLGNKQAVENQPPIANAGVDQAVNVGVKVTLDGNSSNDPDHGPSPITYSWSQTSGPTATLTTPATATPDFTPLAAGTYVFQLIVNNGLTAGAPDTVTVNIGNQPPVANAGADQIVNAGIKVALDGCGSNDPDHGPSPITYSWSQTSGPSVTLANATTTPSFTPLEAGTYMFQLIVNDGLTASAPDTVTITVNDTAYLVIQSPNGGEVWNEGSNQTISWISHNIDRKKLFLFYLSTDNGLNWKKVASTKNVGSKIWNIPKKRYVSKQALMKICLNQKTPLCDTSDAVLTVNKAPVAEAGVKQSVIEGTKIVLNGGTSYDADNGPAAITYKWIQTLGPLVTLNGANTATPTFTPTPKGTYVFGLVVNDGSANSKQDKVTVSVKAAPIIR